MTQDPLFLRTAEMIARLLSLHLTNQITDEEKAALRQWMAYQSDDTREAIRRMLQPKQFANDLEDFRNIDVEAALRDVQWRIFIDSLFSVPKV